MNVISKTLIAAGIFASFSLNVMAADIAPTTSPGIQEHMERMKTMTPEERAKEHEAMHKGMQDMTPEQRAERRREMREHWEKISPEERRQFRKGMMPADRPEKAPAK